MLHRVCLASDEPARNRVDDHVARLENVANQRLVAALRTRRHLREHHLANDPTEAIDPDTHGTPHFGRDDTLIRELDVDQLDLR